MKIHRFLKLVGLISTVVLAGAPIARAIPLTFATSGIGLYAPASSYNNNTDATTAVNLLITWYNGGANPSGGGVTFTLQPGSGIPAPNLPSPATFGFTDETSPFDGFNPATYSYVLGKYGNVAYVFYIGNLGAGSYTLPATMDNLGLSHEIGLTAVRANVPDGGTTIALLGAGLVGLVFFQRRFHRA